MWKRSNDGIWAEDCASIHYINSVSDDISSEYDKDEKAAAPFFRSVLTKFVFVADGIEGAQPRSLLFVSGRRLANGKETRILHAWHRPGHFLQPTVDEDGWYVIVLACGRTCYLCRPIRSTTELKTDTPHMLFSSTSDTPDYRVPSLEGLRCLRILHYPPTGRRAFRFLSSRIRRYFH